MSEVSPWTCPYCNRAVLITKETYFRDQHEIYRPTKYGPLIVVTELTTCPNPECREIQIDASLHKIDRTKSDLKKPGECLFTWKLLPEAHVKIFPNYIPEQLLKSYREACLILEKSPGASATISRRCLQGMIRDFWKIQKRTLKEEVEALQDKVDPNTWRAIDAVRQIGNIGAHMEKDIDLIIDVSSDESALLIQLIETLFNDWYIIRHERERRLEKVIAAADGKLLLKK